MTSDDIEQMREMVEALPDPLSEVECDLLLEALTVLLSRCQRYGQQEKQKQVHDLMGRIGMMI
jgi:hypothetical protein